MAQVRRSFILKLFFRSRANSTQKAAKNLAARNAALLLRTHIITACLHAVFLFLHWTFNRPGAMKPYFLLACPTLAIEFYLERLGRPQFHAADGSLRSAGEDLGASGLTEYMWDVLYWTWGLPVYTVWLAYSTFTGMKSGLAGMGGAPDAPQAAGESKRQKKVEKRGGQRMQYR
ncbi:hypothetical protein MW887_003264 [Aspergillus wentii]|nr:hypothetical protein MW887_003264 [Aspergillus wentii]